MAMDQDEAKPRRAKLFVAGLIVVGVALTGNSLVQRVEAIENYPRMIFNVVQQSCDTNPYANPLANVRGESANMTDRPC